MCLPFSLIVSIDSLLRYVASSDRVFSQFDMSMVLLAFFGSYVLYPKSYGGRFNSERDLKAFAHTWRVFGYYCGIEVRRKISTESRLK